MIDLSKIEGFDWDSGNISKNQIKHQVLCDECEEIFNNIPLLFLVDEKHSIIESRYYVLGRTNNDRYLFLSLTIRKNKFRIISARDMNKIEKQTYEQNK
jgi:uncharacterized DUF497 family protein